MKELTKEEREAIEKEAAKKFPYPDVLHDRLQFKNLVAGIDKERAAYIAGATSRELLLKEERERAKGLVEALTELVLELPVDWLGTGGIGSTPEKDAKEWQDKWDSVINQYNKSVDNG